MWAILNPRLKASYAKNFNGAVAITAVPFNSDRPDGSSDDSNRTIAQKIFALNKKLRLPVYVQREHARVLRELGMSPTAVRESKTGEWVKSHDFIKWLAAQLPRGARVVLVGHRHHVRRCAILMRHYGLVPLVAKESEEVPYDKYGSQSWTTNPLLYIPWEYLSRAVLFSLWLRGEL